MLLQDKVSSITGSVCGIGKDTAKAFVKKDAKVIIAGLNFQAAKILLRILLHKAEAAIDRQSMAG